MIKPLSILPVSVFWIASAQAVQYTITDLGEPGWRSPTAVAINNQGQVLLTFRTSSNQPLAFLYDNGQRIDLGEFVPAGLNNLGQAAGWIRADEGGAAAAMYTADGGIQVIGKLNGYSAYAQDINEAGQIVGYTLEGRTGRAFSWHEGVFTDLSVESWIDSGAKRVNSLGQTLGWSRASDSYSVSCIFQPDGTLQELGLTDDGGLAYDINDTGWTVGRNNFGGSSTAFLRDPQGNLTDLGILAGTYYYSLAYGINNVGQVVGEAGIATREFHAFLYEDGRMTDLNDYVSSPGWELTGARAVNDRGQIIGVGRHDGQWTAFLLTPVPEPATLLLLGLGLAGLRRCRGRTATVK